MSAVGWLTDPAAAFALARASTRPLLLYWGASWCPPCNRIKATAFAHPDFAALAPALVPLAIDGDSAGAQALAGRLGVRSYPTLVLYRPDGAEITRLPCELSGQRFIEILTLALAAPMTAAQAFDAALAGQGPLPADAWRLLGFYSWDTDEARLLGQVDAAAALAALARDCDQPEAALRLAWHALHAASEAAGRDGQAGMLRSEALARIGRDLSDPQVVRTQMDLVTNDAPDLVRFLTPAPAPSPERLRLTQAWSQALMVIEDEQAFSVADRLAALRTRIRMARLGAALPGLEGMVRGRVATALLSVQDPALRHQVLNTAAGLLSDAGMLDDAEEVLSDALERSHAPYYFMHNLAALAKKRGDAAAALDWYERAWRQARGPATRLQWGATCLQALVDFAPREAAPPAHQARVERLADELRAELNGMDDVASQRNGTQLKRIAAALAAWGGSAASTLALDEAVARRRANPA